MSDEPAYTPREEYKCDGSTTHYMGCKCHEARRNAREAELEALAARLGKQVAHLDCGRGSLAERVTLLVDVLKEAQDMLIRVSVGENCMPATGDMFWIRIAGALWAAERTGQSEVELCPRHAGPNDNVVLLGDCPGCKATRQDKKERLVFQDAYGSHSIESGSKGISNLPDISVSEPKTDIPQGTYQSTQHCCEHGNPYLGPCTPCAKEAAEESIKNETGTSVVEDRKSETALAGVGITGRGREFDSLPVSTTAQEPCPGRPARPPGQHSFWRSTPGGMPMCGYCMHTMTNEEIQKYLKASSPHIHNISCYEPGDEWGKTICGESPNKGNKDG